MHIQGDKAAMTAIVPYLYQVATLVLCYGYFNVLIAKTDIVVELLISATH